MLGGLGPQATAKRNESSLLRPPVAGRDEAGQKASPGPHAGHRVEWLERGPVQALLAFLHQQREAAVITS